MNKIKTLGGILIVSATLFVLQTSGVVAQDYCEGNFDNDRDQDGSDAFLFKTDFGRSSLGNPCPPDSIWKIFQDGTDESVEWVDATNPRFAIHDDMVLDKDTGLIWARNANLAGNQMIWQDAINYCRELVLGNRKGWRLPTVEELASLLDMSQRGPALSLGHPFVNVQLAWHWTSTTKSEDFRDAKIVNMWGTVLNGSKIGHEQWVWPVRGGNGYATGNW